MLVRVLFQETASPRFCFLEVEENIWLRHCYPEMLADAKAREKECILCMCFLLWDNCLWWRGGGEIDPLLQTCTDLVAQRDSDTLFAGTTKSLLTSVFIQAGRLTWSFHVTLTSYITPCLVICNCSVLLSFFPSFLLLFSTVLRLGKLVCVTWDQKQELLCLLAESPCPWTANHMERLPVQAALRLQTSRGGCWVASGVVVTDLAGEQQCSV